MVFPFPVPGGHVRLAYRELHIAINGTEEEKKALGNHALLSRPWEPATCLDPELRHDLWDWLRSEEHTSELQSLMRSSYAVFCLKKKNTKLHKITIITTAIQYS